MNQNTVMFVSIGAFALAVSVIIFVYFQEPQVPLSYTGMHCDFANDSLLNYLRNPECSRPLGVELYENYGCVTWFDRTGFTKVECEDPNKAQIQNGCLRVNLGDNNALLECR